MECNLTYVCIHQHLKSCNMLTTHTGTWAHIPRHCSFQGFVIGRRQIRPSSSISARDSFNSDLVFACHSWQKSHGSVDQLSPTPVSGTAKCFVHPTTEKLALWLLGIKLDTRGAVGQLKGASLCSVSDVFALFQPVYPFQATKAFLSILANDSIWFDSWLNEASNVIPRN